MHRTLLKRSNLSRIYYISQPRGEEKTIRILTLDIF